MNIFSAHSGQIEYTGDLESLLHRIIRLDGVLVSDQKFECLLYVPDHTKAISLIGRRFSVRLRCRYEECPHGFRIFYRARPTLRYYVPAFLMLVVLIVCLCQGLQAPAYLWGAIAIALAFIIFTLCFFFVRSICVKHFCDTFSHSACTKKKSSGNRRVR